jgi:hypothetical protein
VLAISIWYICQVCFFHLVQLQVAAVGQITAAGVLVDALADLILLLGVLQEQYSWH